jgi:3-methyladenine DNA glycosylase AlkD
MSQFVSELREKLEFLADPEIAVPQAKYMKNKFDFLGIKSPERKAVFKAVLKEQGMPKKVWEVAKSLWEQNEREFQYCAIELLAKYAIKKMQESDIEEIETFITTKSWWDSVDGFSSIVGNYFLQYPEHKKAITDKWLKSENIWLIRMAIIFQLSYKSKTDTALLYSNILEVAHHKDFFVRKAIGWALRQYAKTNPLEVETFVAEHENILSNLSKKEALKRR